MQRRIHLEGSLKDLHKDVIDLDADNATMMMSGLNANISSFSANLRKLDGFYVVVRNDTTQQIKCIESSNWLMPFGDYADVHIIPKADGAGYEAAAYVYAALESYGTYVAIAAAAVTFIAVTYATAMLAAALMPAPAASIGSSTADSPSFLFNGAENTALEGVPVPLVYGRVLTGSVVISVDQDVADIPVTTGS